MLWFVELLSSTEEFKVEPSMVVNSVECLYQAAIAGLGIISLSDDSILLRENKLVRILPELCSDELRLYCVYPTALKTSKTIQSMLGYLKNAYNSSERIETQIILIQHN